MSLSNEHIEHLAGTRTVDFTTVGRRSGNERTVEIWWFHHDGRFIVTGTPGRRDWLANVRANPTVRVATPEFEVSGLATEVTDGAWKRGFFKASSPSWYRSQAELDDLVEMAPMIEITDLQPLG